MSAAGSSGDAVLPLSAAPRKRLRGKTNLQEASRSHVAAEDEVSDAHRSVYLITFAHPQALESADGRALVAPGRFTREGIAQALRDAAANPLHSAEWLQHHPAARPEPVQIKQLTVFREYHMGVNGGRGQMHYHVAVLFHTSVRFTPFKRALLWVHGLATYWSCSHTATPD